MQKPNVISKTGIKREEVRQVAEYKVWLDGDWYIPVDETGRCVSDCYEGALGFIIKIKSVKNPNAAMALKIPRLLGETHRENSYVNELLEQELRSVAEIFQTPGGHDNVLYADPNSPTRGPINSERGSKEAAQYDGYVIFVKFEKGTRPFFFLAKPNVDGTINTYPNGISSPLQSQEDFERIKARAAGGESEWQGTVFVCKANTNTEPVEVFSSLNYNSFDHYTHQNTVYTCFPSIKYKWASGTLQEAISLGKRRTMDGKNWGFNEHIDLMERLIIGIDTLHSKGLLHADLRPANIVYLGEQPWKPGSYVVADYGSLANPNAPITGVPEGVDGFTFTLGPIATPERTSVFYSPERGVGREREAADTLVVLDDDNFYTLIFGYREDLLKKETTNERLVIDEQKVRAIKGSAKPIPTEERTFYTLEAGDRVRCRDFIFELRQTEKREASKNIQVLEVEKYFWKLYHGRVSVSAKRSDLFVERNANQEWYPVPRTIELLRWSVSTDMYSLGVLFLYSIYMDRIDVSTLPTNSFGTEGTPAGSKLLITQ